MRRRGPRNSTWRNRGSFETSRPWTSTSGGSNVQATFNAGRSAKLASSRYSTPPSKTTSTTTPSSGAATSISDSLEAFVGDLDRLDRNLICLRVEGRAFPFADPAAAEVPPHDFVPLVVEQHDRAVAAIDASLDDAF